MEKLVAISLGAGVQSSVLLLMACKGELPKPDRAIFADTKWEPEGVYDYLRGLQKEAEAAGIPVDIVERGDIRDAFLNRAPIKASPPIFTRKDGEEKTSILHRQCTMDYKIVPIRRRLRELQTHYHQPVELWLGITTDEIMRKKDSRVKWVTHRWPLLERKMSRHDCFRWIEQHGYPMPPKSACIGCPYHSDAAWEHMRLHDPSSWLQALDLDNELRSGVWDGTLDATPYLHRAGVPLAQVELKPKEKDRLDLWAEECEGMCGF